MESSNNDLAKLLDFFEFHKKTFVNDKEVVSKKQKKVEYSDEKTKKLINNCKELPTVNDNDFNVDKDNCEKDGVIEPNKKENKQIVVLL